MNLLTDLPAVDKDTWLRGTIGGFISGGAGSVVAGFAVNLIDPNDFNLVHPAKFFKLIATIFLANGTISMMKFLTTNPLPARVVTTTVQKVQSDSPAVPDKTITTVQETHKEP